MNLDLSEDQSASQQPQQPGQHPPRQYPPRQTTSSSGCLPVGCIVALVIFLVLIVGGGLYVYFNFKSLATDAVVSALRTAVNDSQLPAEQKQAIVDRVEQLGDDYKAGRISDEQLVRVVEKIMESPILHVGMVMLAEQQYVRPSGLSDQEKAEARRTLQRLARGVYEKKISESELEQVAAPIMNQQPDGSTELKQTVTDAELRAFLKLARDTADEHQVPDEPFDVNIAEEMEKAIESALEGK